MNKEPTHSLVLCLMPSQAKFLLRQLEPFTRLQDCNGDADLAKTIVDCLNAYLNTAKKG